jgi:hypothetical protein
VQIRDVALNSRQQTANDIYKIAREYWTDLLPFQNWTLEQFYNYVHSIPFIADDIYSDDHNHYEIISRPLYLLDRELFPFIDCKKKTTLFASFAEMQGWTWILYAVSFEPGIEPHHILLLIWKNDDWLPVDANMPENYLFEIPIITEGEIL